MEQTIYNHRQQTVCMTKLVVACYNVYQRSDWWMWQLPGSRPQMSQKYNINCNFVHLIQIRHSIPLTWRQTLSSCQTYNRAIVDDIHICVSTKVVSLLSCTTKDLYSELLYRRPRTPKCLEKWRTIYDGLSDEVVENYFRLPFYAVRETKTQSFQYKMIHRIINCNKKLYEMKIKPSPLCDHCGSVDDIPHFFVLCRIVLLFWKDFFGWWNSFNHIIGQSFDLTGTKEILFGIQPGFQTKLWVWISVFYMLSISYTSRDYFMTIIIQWKIFWLVYDIQQP